MPSDKSLPSTHKARSRRQQQNLTIPNSKYHGHLRSSSANNQTKFAVALNKFTRLVFQFLIVYLLLDILVLKQSEGFRSRRNIATYDHSAEIYRQEEDNVIAECSTYPIITEEDVLQVISTAQRDTQPKYNTRRNKFLIPFSMQGVDGQVRGLREAIYLAIKLDRTLVLPPFFNDPWLDPEEGSNQKIDPRLEPEPYDADTHFDKLHECKNDNCTEFHAEHEEHRLKYKVTYEAFDDEDFEAGLLWKQEYFKPADTILPMSSIIDIELLSTLLPVITTSQMKDNCYAQFDVAYLGRTNYCHGPKTMRIVQYEQLTGIEIFNRTRTHVHHCPNFLAHYEPRDYEINDDDDAKRVDLPFESEFITENIYKDDAACAAWIYPKGNVDFSRVFADTFPDDVEYYLEQEGGFNTLSRKTAKTEENQIVSDSVIGTSRPHYVRKIATGFARQVIKDKILIVAHWRFLSEHWFEPCRMHHGKTKQEYIYCRQLRKYQHTPDPDDYLFYGFLSRISPLKATGQPLAIYLATPDDDPERVQEIRKDLEKYSGQVVITEVELKAYIKTVFARCGFVMRHFDLVFRLVEEELAVSSAIAFMRSTNSAWSYNVFIERFVRKRTTYDFSVIDVLKSL